MRLSTTAALAAIAAFCSACGPAVGSPDWCKQFTERMQNNPNALQEMAKLSAEEQKGLEQCMTNAFSGAFGQ